MSVAILALATLVVVQAPAAAKTAPMTVQVEASTKAAPPGVAEWTSELRTALAARKDEFRLAKPGEKAELVVRIDSVGQQDGTSSLNGALVMGEAKREFRYSFTNVRAEAEKLARNLRKVADQMKASGK